VLAPFVGDRISVKGVQRITQFENGNVHKETMPPRIVRAACGDKHSVLLTGASPPRTAHRLTDVSPPRSVAEGDVYTYGCGEHGQLGHGYACAPLTLSFSLTPARARRTTDRHGAASLDMLRPRLVEGLQGHRVVSAACGANFTVFITGEDERGGQARRQNEDKGYTARARRSG
jgi:hypothetical protein